MTDDELLLLDLLFNVAATQPMLSRDNIKLQFNYRAHNLTDEELAAVVTRFCEQGYLKRFSDSEQGQYYFEMTPLGGALWERERQPQWDRYGIDRYRTAPNGLELLSFVSPSEETCNSFVTHWPPANARRRQWRMKHHELLGWRRFPQLFVGVAVYEPTLRVETPAIIEHNRTWWRSVRELQQLIPRQR